MRPIIMTCMIACMGLLPAALSSGIGSQVQKPLAIGVVGGMVFAPLLDRGHSAGAGARLLPPARALSAAPIEQELAG
jgi:hypothetical protein